MRSHTHVYAALYDSMRALIFFLFNYLVLFILICDFFNILTSQDCARIKLFTYFIGTIAYVAHIQI